MYGYTTNAKQLCFQSNIWLSFGAFAPQSIHSLNQENLLHVLILHKWVPHMYLSFAASLWNDWRIKTLDFAFSVTQVQRSAPRWYPGF